MLNNIYPLIVMSPVQSGVSSPPFNESMVVPIFESSTLWIDDEYSLVLLGG